MRERVNECVSVRTINRFNVLVILNIVIFLYER